MRFDGKNSLVCRLSAGIAAAVCGSFLCAGAAEISIRSATVAPTAVRRGIDAPVVFTATIQDPAVIASSVNLQRLDSATGVFANKGPLFDDGTHGDSRAGDGIFSLRIFLNESGPFPVVFRVSAAVHGHVSRIFSTPITLNAAAANTAVIELKPEFRALAEIFGLPATYISDRAGRYTE